MELKKLGQQLWVYLLSYFDNTFETTQCDVISAISLDKALFQLKKIQNEDGIK